MAEQLKPAQDAGDASAPNISGATTYDTSVDLTSKRDSDIVKDANALTSSGSSLHPLDLQLDMERGCGSGSVGPDRMTWTPGRFDLAMPGGPSGGDRPHKPSNENPDNPNRPHEQQPVQNPGRVIHTFDSPNGDQRIPLSMPAKPQDSGKDRPPAETGTRPGDTPQTPPAPEAGPPDLPGRDGQGQPPGRPNREGQEPARPENPKPPSDALPPGPDKLIIDFEPESGIPGKDGKVLGEMVPPGSDKVEGDPMEKAIENMDLDLKVRKTALEMNDALQNVHLEALTDMVQKLSDNPERLRDTVDALNKAFEQCGSDARLGVTGDGSLAMFNSVTSTALVINPNGSASVKPIQRMPDGNVVLQPGEVISKSPKSLFKDLGTDANKDIYHTHQTPPPPIA